jgi:hypothetical protein
MPIKQCKLPDGGDGWQWGDAGKRYADRADAEKQAAAAHANGYTGDEWSEEARKAALEARRAKSGGNKEDDHDKEKEQHEISARLKKTTERETAFRHDTNYKRLMEAKKEDKHKIVAEMSPAEAKLHLERLNSAPGDDPAARKALESKIQAHDALALDKASVRTIDVDGHLHIAESNISKATVNPYIGREIPDWKELGLDGDRIYYLLRDPAELKKAVDTFDGKPLLFKHRPVDADDHAYDTVVGAVYNPVFDAPFLKAELVVWPGKAIDAIEDGSKQELSCGYRYKADMTSGVYQGQAYDGVMREIQANHVALVAEGRAGPEVVVGDSNGEIIMSKTVLSRKAAVAQGALLVYLRPKLAQDAKIDLTPILAKITKDNFKDSKPSIITALSERTKGKLAQDASIDDAGSLLDSIAALDIAEDEEKDMPKNAAEDDWDDEDDKKEKAKDKKKSAKDADMDDDKEDDKDEEEQEPKGKAKDKKKGAKDGEPDDLVTKPAMDAAIASAVKTATASAIKTQRDIRDAERVARPYVGELAIAHDSAIDVYRTALDAMGIKTDGINELIALKTILEMQPKASDPKAKAPRVAMDAAGAKSFSEMFPDSAKIRIM